MAPRAPKFAAIEWALDNGTKQYEALKLSVVAVEGGEAKVGAEVSMQWPHPQTNEPHIWRGHIRGLAGVKNKNAAC